MKFAWSRFRRLAWKLTCLLRISRIEPIKKLGSRPSATAEKMQLQPPSNLLCTRCEGEKPRLAYSNRQRQRADRVCNECIARPPLECTRCHKHLPPADFAKNQRKRSTRSCKDCANQAAQRSGTTRSDTGTCTGPCGTVLSWTAFAVDQRYLSSPTCRSCARPGRPRQALEPLQLGPCTYDCPHCHAQLWQHETNGFCCSHGKYALSFGDYFRQPGRSLLRLYGSTWLYKDAQGHCVHDAATNAPRLTVFSAASRRFNNMFCLAMHEIQSSTAEREARFGNELRPANIRIHGTMYRRIFSAEEITPVRYLIIDPNERTAAASRQGLRTTTLRALEKAILPHNTHMHTLQRLRHSLRAAPEASIVLDWHEGTNELAAVVDERSTTNPGPRSIVYRLKGRQRPQYLQPLSPLYEPLSYPLWYPHGGRGWSTDVTGPLGNKVTQMWWYRQQVLRLPQLHLCGRLLNEWFINMYCRMEDERLSLLRRQQQTRVATRAALCEVLANEAVGGATVGRITYLPSSVPGSPRHLRRLRTDALELARRRGPGTFFITLTCNPNWPEIVAALRPGQTAADRPDIVVRVFHGVWRRLWLT